MFKRELIKSCPVVKASRAILRVPTSIVREWAGLLYAEKDCEWLALLVGRRSQGGLLVEVEGMIIPQEQQRSVAQVTLPEHVEAEGVVGVIHSHHGMGAQFSGIDWSTLNKRFWSSIVISYQLDDVKDDERWWMGFDYEAVAQVKLPCGELGIVEMELEVTGEGAEMFSAKKPIDGYTEISLLVPETGDCPTISPEMVNDWQVVWKLGCGHKVDQLYPIQGALGQTTDRRKELPPSEIWVPATTSKGPKGWRIESSPGVLTPAEQAELKALDDKPFHEMTDEEFERWSDLLEREETEADAELRFQGMGEQWVQEDVAWEAYQRTYFEMQKEDGYDV